MSVAFWGSFFRDAGIPSSLAKSYASTFEENRIGKDMLLDLDKEILADMGIKVMGDVIAILKHAKKEARKERPSVPVSSKHTKPSSAVHSTQSAQAPAVSTTSSPLHIDEDYLDEVGLVDYQEGQPDLPTQHHDLQQPEQFGTLHSDQLLFQQVVAAVAQQQQQQQMEEEEELAVGGQVDPVLLGLQEDEFQEEYVTAAYKRQQQKRALGVLYSDDPYVEPQPKQPRLIILPQGDGHRQVGGEELEALGTSAAAASETSSRRMLEAAGLVKRDGVHISPSEKTAVTSSVFSRLDRKTDITSPPSAKQHFSAHSPPSPSSSASSPPSALIPSKRTIVNTSPSPKKLSLRVTSRDGRRVSETQGGGAAADAPGTRRAVMVRKSSSGAKKRESSSGGGLVSSSSSFGNKEPIRNRLGTRSGDHGGGGGRGSSRRSGVTDWPETVSTSITSTSGSSGRVSSRLGGVHRETSASSRKPRPTMMADSASSPPPKVTSRLGTTHKMSKNTVSSAAFSSGSLSSSSRPPQQRKSKPPASMVADEYELKRQLDIRSRLVQREKMVRERRSGPLRGRLGKHRVFQRLT